MITAWGNVWRKERLISAAGIKTIKENGDRIPVAFEASFDFYDAAVGLAIYTEEKELAIGLWITPQEEGAEAPAAEWIEFFIKTLVFNITEDGSYGYPMYSFVNDISDMTVVPTAPEN